MGSSQLLGNNPHIVSCLRVIDSEDYLNNLNFLEYIENNLFLIKTKGGDGVDIIKNSKITQIKGTKVDLILDPTGCGDSFRGGFFHNYIKGKNLEDCVKLGNVMGGFCIEKKGGQNHNPSIKEIKKRYSANYENVSLKNK